MGRQTRLIGRSPGLIAPRRRERRQMPSSGCRRAAGGPSPHRARARHDVDTGRRPLCRIGKDRERRRQDGAGVRGKARQRRDQTGCPGRPGDDGAVLAGAEGCAAGLRHADRVDVWLAHHRSAALNPDAPESPRPRTLRRLRGCPAHRGDRPGGPRDADRRRASRPHRPASAGSAAMSGASPVRWAIRGPRAGGWIGSGGRLRPSGRSLDGVGKEALRRSRRLTDLPHGLTLGRAGGDRQG